MILLDETISLLSDENSSLSGALLKTKVLLHQIGKQELATWVSYELEGYPGEVEVPSYRILQSRVVGHIANGFWRYESHPVPVGHLDAARRKRLEQSEFRQPLSVLQAFCRDDRDGFLTREMPPESYGWLGKTLMAGYRVERAWSQTPAHDVRGALTQVRSRLLDFLLELKRTLGDAESEESVKEKTDAVDIGQIFTHAVFGNNATIILGSRNALTINSEVHAGDFASLSRALQKGGIPDSDIDALHEAITEDEAKGGAALSKGRTGSWFLQLMEKSAKGGLKVATDVVAHVATEALTKYLGG